jgi:opacity protein-like surface antigen
MKFIRRKNTFAATLAGTVALSTSLLAQEAQSPNGQAGAPKPTTELEKTAPKSDPWRFGVALIGWGPGISGDVTVRGRQADVDVRLDELLDHLKGIAMLGFELRKEKFGFYAQPNWIKLKADGNVGPLSSTVEEKLWIVDAAGFYQLHKWCEERPLTLDALVGVRYWHIDNELTVHGARGVVDFNGSDSNYLIDPILGLRGKKYFTQKFSLNLHGDVGGFGASDNSSDLSWQALGTLGYDFTQHFSVNVGYRALSVDKDSGSGPNAKGLNTILHGFLLALNFQW